MNPITTAQETGIFDGIESKIVISLLSSLFTAIIFTAGKSLWDGKIYPLWLKLFRKNDQDINGIWYSVYKLDNGEAIVDKMTLKQSGHLLAGEFEYSITAIDGTVEVRFFTMKGELKNDIVTAYYINTNRKHKGVGSLTLQIINNGEALKGFGVFYNTLDDKLVSHEYSYKRKP